MALLFSEIRTMIFCGENKMKEFKININGRVKNFNLPENKSLIPLFEAVVNSLQSIEERRKFSSFDAKILIKIEREKTISPEVLGHIENITIVDNGIGFDEANFQSFLESDSNYKNEIGGKGVGRFSWLKAFEKATIDSYFLVDEECYHRSFDFSLKDNGINDNVFHCERREPETTIKLCSFSNKYKKKTPDKIETIAIKLIQHCFIYFINNDCPTITLMDDKGHSVNLNELFKNKVLLETGSDTFSVEGNLFHLTKIQVGGELINNHKLYLCANNRLVDSRDLSKQIVNLDKSLGADSKFWFLGIVTSNYLDENVDMNRLSFSIPESADDGFYPIVTINKIVTESTCLIEKYLSDYLRPIAEEKKKRISSYISAQAPQYRHLLRYMPDALDSIKPGVTDDKLDLILYQIDRDFELETKKEGKQLVDDLKNDITQAEEYKRRFEEHVARISDENKSILAKYVAHRKSIIDLFEAGMCKNSDDKYVKEEFMHNLIYPMRKTSDEIDYEQHNLWLVDERLAYFFFASSDIPFNNDRSEDRPDLMLFDNSIALLESKNDGTAYDTIVLFELKKPMRSDLTTNNPVNQITNYMQKIQTNTVTDKNGRIIRTDEHTKFYLYVVCDAIETYRSILKNTYGFKETIDRLGMFRMNDNQYIEVLTYDKIINDAKKRNKILFDKLGI